MAPYQSSALDDTQAYTFNETNRFTVEWRSRRNCRKIKMSAGTRRTKGSVNFARGNNENVAKKERRNYDQTPLNKSP